jgi:hypothetical protein
MTPVQILATIIQDVHPEIFNLKTSKGRKLLQRIAETMEIEKIEFILTFEEGKTSGKKQTGENHYQEKFKLKNL